MSSFRFSKIHYSVIIINETLTVNFLKSESRNTVLLVPEAIADAERIAAKTFLFCCKRLQCTILFFIDG